MRIEITSLTKSYRGGVTALDGVDLAIDTGMYGLLGPNGAGKTTLMRILAGVIRPTSGSIRVGTLDAGTDRDRTALKRMLGYLPQDLGLYPDLSAQEFLDYIAVLKGIDDRRRRRDRVAELLETVGLADVARRRLRGFSGGMKRRVGIAQALLNDPRLLIVDEPTAGLDPEERIRFRTLLVELAGDRTVLLSTHIVEDIGQTCRRLAVLAGGNVIFEGDTEGLIRHATGQVWTVETEGPPPTGDLTVVAALHGGGRTRYRLVGTPPEGALTAEPGLEEGYVALMRSRRSDAVPAVTAAVS